MQVLSTKYDHVSFGCIQLSSGAELRRRQSGVNGLAVMGKDD